MLRRSQGVIQRRRETALSLSLSIELICMCLSAFSHSSLSFYYLFLLFSLSQRLLLYFPLQKHVSPFALSFVSRSHQHLLSEMYWNASAVSYILPHTWLFTTTLIHLQGETAFVWLCSRMGCTELPGSMKTLFLFFFHSHNVVLFKATNRVSGSSMNWWHRM